jgi:hypothetical protein
MFFAAFLQHTAKHSTAQQGTHNTAQQGTGSAMLQLLHLKNAFGAPWTSSTLPFTCILHLSVNKQHSTM